MNSNDKKTILVIGSGRLVVRVLEDLNQYFTTTGSYKVEHISSKEFKENEDTIVQEASFQNTKKVLRARGIDMAKAVVLVDSNDDINIHLLLAILKLRGSMPIVATFFHDKLVASLERDHKNVVIINPAKTASSNIVEMIKNTTEAKEHWWFEGYLPKYRANHSLNRATLFLSFFAILFTVGSGIFSFTQNLKILESVYMMTTIITSVNFNDAQLVNSTPPIRIVMTLLMLTTYFFVLYALAVVIDELDKNRTETATYGRRRYKLSNHVIVCGLGRVGYATVKKLLAQKIKVLVFEKDPDNKFLRYLKYNGVPVFIGDASLPENLRDAGIVRARALIASVGGDFSKIGGDFSNLEIALSARSIKPDIRIGLRVFDQEMAEEVKVKFRLHHTFSKSSLASKEIKNRLVRMLEMEIKAQAL